MINRTFIEKYKKRITNYAISLENLSLITISITNTITIAWYNNIYEGGRLKLNLHKEYIF